MISLCCGSATIRYGHTKSGCPRYKCKTCDKISSGNPVGRPSAKSKKGVDK